jgi:hypothetical protein
MMMMIKVIITSRNANFNEGKPSTVHLLIAKRGAEGGIKREREKEKQICSIYIQYTTMWVIEF